MTAAQTAAQTPTAAPVPPQDATAAPSGARVPPDGVSGPHRPSEAAGCPVCHRPLPDTAVCDRCRVHTADQLAALPGLAARLTAALVPGPGGGERVSDTRGEAPMPARLSALSLLAAGSDDARCVFVPAVRVWYDTEPAPGGASTTAVRHWHRETVRDGDGRLVMMLADDQTGVLPLTAWLRAWSTEWRLTLGHHSGPRTPARRDPARRDPARRTRLSLADRIGALGYRPPAERPADPAAEEWAQRWPGDGDWSPAARRHHAYLSEWLSEVADRAPSFADFAASLRTLTGATRAALGDIDDLEYVGRCPEEVRSAAHPGPTICGAPIWHDPYASVITCPRCRTETSHDRVIWLARRILDAWPIDRRRRYPLGLIDVLRQPTCATCGSPVSVQWIDATERADRESFWRPGTLSCRNLCAVTG